MLSKRLHLRRKGLSVGKVPSFFNKDYGPVVHFVYNFIKSLNLISYD